MDLSIFIKNWPNYDGKFGAQIVANLKNWGKKAPFCADSCWEIIDTSMYSLSRTGPIAMADSALKLSPSSKTKPYF